MSQTHLRYLAMLRHVPRLPLKIDARSLQGRLEAEGFEPVTLRTIERDLEKLSRDHALVVDDRSKPYGWSFRKDAPLMSLPHLNSPEALSLRLAERLISPVLSRKALPHLEPYLASADALLGRKGDAMARAWEKRVRIIPGTQELLPPKLVPGVTETVYEALLLGRRLLISYRAREADASAPPSEAEISPLGLVFRNQVVYLIARYWEYDNVRQLALHRIQAVTMLESRAEAPKGFDLDAYIRERNFDYVEGDAPLRLCARFTTGAAWHLHETPLSEDQRIEEEPGGETVLITATVRDTSQLRWWLRGFGAGVEILEPQALRKEFVAEAAALSKNYAATA